LLSVCLPNFLRWPPSSNPNPQKIPKNNTAMRKSS
jgi:hypothetical protein